MTQKTQIIRLKTPTAKLIMCVANLLLILSLVAGVVDASAKSAIQRYAQSTCSCTPRSYEFSVSFNGDCGSDTLQDDGGIQGSICFFTQVSASLM